MNELSISNPPEGPHDCGEIWEFIGTLGNLEHYRCRGCHLYISRPVLYAEEQTKGEDNVHGHQLQD